MDDTMEQITAREKSKRPHIIRLIDAAGRVELVGFKQLTDASRFVKKISETEDYAKVQISSANISDLLGNGFWQPIEDFQMHGVTAEIQRSGGKMWTI